MVTQYAREDATNSELDAKKIVTFKQLTSAQRDELIEQFVYNTLTDDYSKLSDSELKDEIKYTFDEETLEELVDNITNTDPIVYNTNINGGKF